MEYIYIYSCIYYRSLPAWSRLDTVQRVEYNHCLNDPRIERELQETDGIQGLHPVLLWKNVIEAFILRNLILFVYISPIN